MGTCSIGHPYRCNPASPILQFRLKQNNFAFIDEDLAQAGWRKFLPSKAEYFRSFLCRSCKLYVVDYSKSLSRPEAEQAAHAI
jgi:hypothetical protein